MKKTLGMPLFPILIITLSVAAPLNSIRIDALNNSQNLTFKQLLNSVDWENALKETFLPETGQDDKPLYDLKISKSCVVELSKIAKVLNGSITGILTSPVGKMLDAWGKPPDRILLGNINWLGASDECDDIKGKYCLATMRFLDMYPGTYGVCFPNQCSSTDVYEVLMMLQIYAKGIIKFPSYSQGGHALCKEPKHYDSGVKATIACFFVILCFCLVGTIVEVIQNMQTVTFVESNMTYYVNETEEMYNDGISFPTETTIFHDPKEADKKNVLVKGNVVSQFFICFSLIKNTKAILSTELPKGGIASINGIRTISMFWVILGHFYFFATIVGKPDNILDVGNIVHRFTFLAISNATVSVDSFFLLSGLLVAYLTLKRMDEFPSKSRFQVICFWCKYYLHRYLRLTPSLGIMMLLYLYILPLTITGPYSTQISTEAALPHFRAPCIKYWWTNILYINNFYPEEMSAQCVGWVWYLANDMQFYVISPVILYALYFMDQNLRSRSRYCGAFLLFFCLCSISFLIIGLLVGINNYPALGTATRFPNNPRASEVAANLNAIYEKPYTRISPYLVGLLLGYIMSRNIQIRHGLKKPIVIFCWLTATATALAIIYGPWKVFKPNGTFFNDAENTIYHTFSRFAWAVSVAWVIYACHYQFGGYINSFLSWRTWIPLSRLTFGAYLMHPLVLIYFYMVQEKTFHFQDNLAVFYIISVTIVSYACAFVLALTVEYPVANLEKKFLS